MSRRKLNAHEKTVTVDSTYRDYLHNNIDLHLQTPNIFSLASKSS